MTRYCNNKFAFHIHTFIIHALIFNVLNMSFIKTPNSWLFHITKICTSKYLEKDSKNKITFHFIIFSY